MVARMVRLFTEERYIRLAFRASLWVKGLFAVIEIAGGTVAFFMTREFLVRMANVITHGELAEDPHDFVANYLQHSVQYFSVGTRHFTAFYLLGHGLIKLWLVIGLLRGRIMYYPTALMVFAFFIAYQLYRFDFTHSLTLLAVTAVDLIVMGLTWHEYRYLRRTLPRAG